MLSTFPHCASPGLHKAGPPSSPHAQLGAWAAWTSTAYTTYICVCLTRKIIHLQKPMIAPEREVKDKTDTASRSISTQPLDKSGQPLAEPEARLVPCSWSYPISSAGICTVLHANTSSWSPSTMNDLRNNAAGMMEWHLIGRGSGGLIKGFWEE